MEPKQSKRRTRAGRPSHQPTEASRKLVSALAGVGATRDYIAVELGIGKTTLEKHYRQELDHGADKANAAVAQSLFKMAVGHVQRTTQNGQVVETPVPPNVTAAIFWAKTRMGWREVQTVNEAKAGGKAVYLKIVEGVDEDAV